MLAAEHSHRPSVPNPSVPSPSVPNPSVPNPSVPNPSVPNPSVPSPSAPRRSTPRPLAPRPLVPSPLDRAVRVSRTFARKLGHLLRVDGDELASTALIEMARARSSYDAAHGLSLETFLTLRARWAMLTRAKRMRRRFAPRRGMPAGVARRYHDGCARRLCLRPEKDHRAVRSLLEFTTLDSGGVVPTADLAETAVQAGPGPEVLAMRRQTRNTLDRAMATLPPEERIVLRLHYYSSLKFVKIASMLGLTRQRVCKLHRAALARCRRYLLRTGCDRASLGA